jgi:hypothetical protein
MESKRHAVLDTPHARGMTILHEVAMRDATKEKPHPAGGTGRGLYVLSPFSTAPGQFGDNYDRMMIDGTSRIAINLPHQSTTWTMRRERGSTSTVSPFTTV